MIKGGGIPSLARYSRAQGGRLRLKFRQPKGVRAWKIGKLENWKTGKLEIRKKSKVCASTASPTLRG
jgi:hypothetical protein